MKIAMVLQTARMKNVHFHLYVNVMLAILEVVGIQM